VEFYIATGSIADVGATFTVLVEHGDVATLTDAAAVPDDLLISTEVAAFQFDDDDQGNRLHRFEALRAADDHPGEQCLGGAHFRRRCAGPSDHGASRRVQVFGVHHAGMTGSAEQGCAASLLTACPGGGWFSRISSRRMLGDAIEVVHSGATVFLRPV
jgi:hypothetical protein